MKFQVNQDSNTAVIQVMVEKLDASNASELKSELLILNKNGVNSMVLDLTKTRYCDSSGLSSILTANRLCKETNGTFVLAGLQKNVMDMIRIAQLDRVLNITETVSQAQDLINL